MIASIISSSDTLSTRFNHVNSIFVPATIKLISLFHLFSSRINNKLPLILPTTPATGLKGISLMIKLMKNLIKLPFLELSWSTLNTVLITWTSFLNPSSNNGLIGRSIKRDTKVAFSVGLPSLLINHTVSYRLNIIFLDINC